LFILNEKDKKYERLKKEKKPQGNLRKGEMKGKPQKQKAKLPAPIR